MPKYNFVCNKCNTKKHKYVPSNIEMLSCERCGTQMSREFPVLSGRPQVTEKVDTYTGVNLNQDHDELIRDRYEQNYWEVEIPRLVQKYSLETCLENQWLIYDDKGDLVINKPPSKR
jgi:transcription elongation factor Elf1